MVTIGLVGEAPTDTDAIKNILKQKYPEGDFSYVTLLNNINGSQLDSPKTKRFLRVEYESLNPNVIVFIRDLDSLYSNKGQLAIRKAYFSSNNSVVDHKGIYLLHVYEMEAMLLADIDYLNSYFDVKLSEVENVMNISEPKEYLLSNIKNYCISMNADILDGMDFNTVVAQCHYFKIFIRKFDKLLGSL